MSTPLSLAVFYSQYFHFYLASLEKKREYFGFSTDKRGNLSLWLYLKRKMVQIYRLEKALDRHPSGMISSTGTNRIIKWSCYFKLRYFVIKRLFEQQLSWDHLNIALYAHYFSRYKTIKEHLGFIKNNTMLLSFISNPRGLQTLYHTTTLFFVGNNRGKARSQQTRIGYVSIQYCIYSSYSKIASIGQTWINSMTSVEMWSNIPSFWVTWFIIPLLQPFLLLPLYPDSRWTIRLGV